MIMQLTELTPSGSMTTNVNQDSTDWSKAFNTSILSTVLDSKGHEQNLEMIIQSPEYTLILAAARQLSDQLGLSPEEATERLIRTFRDLDQAWSKILVKKGAETLMGFRS